MFRCVLGIIIYTKINKEEILELIFPFYDKYPRTYRASIKRGEFMLKI